MQIFKIYIKIKGLFEFIYMSEEYNSYGPFILTYGYKILYRGGQIFRECAPKNFINLT